MKFSKGKCKVSFIWGGRASCTDKRWGWLALLRRPSGVLVDSTARGTVCPGSKEGSQHPGLCQQEHHQETEEGIILPFSTC